MKKKYYDCSVNDASNSLHQVTSYGSIENDIMMGLSRHAYLFNWERIGNYKNADVIITNTTYPDCVLDWCERYSIPKIKRMDGIFWQKKLIYRNEFLNQASTLSDAVIFISQYSKKCYYKLYGDKLKSTTVILNNVDDDIFYPRKINKIEDFTSISSATNWARSDKRLQDIIRLSERIYPDVIKLIGHCDVNLPSNIVKLGYIDDVTIMNYLINSSDVFLSPFFRDAGSKVTCQAVNCNLPVLFSSTGGLPEIVKNGGIEIEDYNDIDFLDEVPNIDIDNMVSRYNEIKLNYKDIKNKKSKSFKYKDTMSKYFDVFNKFCH